MTSFGSCQSKIRLRCQEAIEKAIDNLTCSYLLKLAQRRINIRIKVANEQQKQ